MALFLNFGLEVDSDAAENIASYVDRLKQLGEQSTLHSEVGIAGQLVGARERFGRYGIGSSCSRAQQDVPYRGAWWTYRALSAALLDARILAYLWQDLQR